jgi:uncharacterized protein YndB with AHSA1/START domain
MPLCRLSGIVSTMRELLSEIEIAAPPERVWEVLTDFEAYP